MTHHANDRGSQLRAMTPAEFAGTITILKPLVGLEGVGRDGTPRPTGEDPMDAMWECRHGRLAHDAHQDPACDCWTRKAAA